MGLRAVLGLVIAGAAGYFVYENRSALGLTPAVDDLIGSISDMEGTLIGWANVGEGPTWVPVINQTEASLGIPTNLLSRMAYEESHFRADIITGATASSAGAQGILQLEPGSFPNLRLTPPYSTADTQDQISAAGGYLMSLYNQFQDWSQAVGAYDMGPTAMAQAIAGTRAVPTETTNYVSQIFADVPVAPITIPA
jgi:soluble lytic murein transglycosylase-like protein